MSWCQYPFHSIMFKEDFEIRPCCRYVLPFNERSTVKSVAHAQDIFENGYFKSIRDDMAAGRWNKGCDKCRVEELRGIKSLRQQQSELYPEDEDSELRLTHMEIGTGRVCNLKCRSCSALSSIKWESDAHAMGEIVPSQPAELDLENLSVEHFRHVTYLKITGGEPLLHRQLSGLLERLVAGDLHRQIEIELFSNATIAPNASLLHTLSHFKKIHLKLSIDAVAERNTYLRHPASWSSVLDCARTWREWTSAGGHSLAVAATVSTYNIYYMPEFFRWIDSDLGGAPVTLQIVHDPIYMSAMALPANVKRNLRGHLEANLDSAHSRRYGPKLFKILAEDGDGSESVENFYLQTGTLDRLRKENFAAVFPELHLLLSAWRETNHG